MRLARAFGCATPDGYLHESTKLSKIKCGACGERTITLDFGIDLKGRLGKSRLTSDSFAESSSCQDNVVKRPPNAGRVASLNSKPLTCLSLSSANRSIARSDRSTFGNESWRNQLQLPPLSFVYKPRYPLPQVSKSNSRWGSRSAYR
jgi:hypothetical protein